MDKVELEDNIGTVEMLECLVEVERMEGSWVDEA